MRDRVEDLEARLAEIVELKPMRPRRGPALPFALPGGLAEFDRIAVGFDVTVVRP